MFGRFIKVFCCLAIVFSLAGCSTFSNKGKRALSPSDTIVVDDDSDEYFVGSGDRFVAHGFDPQKTEYNYTQADVVESLYFNFDSFKVLPNNRDKISDIAKVFMRNRSLQILVVGKCDKFGGEQYNFSLGQRRAEAVKDCLASFGIDADRIVTASLGSCVANGDAESKDDGAKDRCCDIVIRRM